jgi:hypothetical protein
MSGKTPPPEAKPAADKQPKTRTPNEWAHYLGTVRWAMLPRHDGVDRPVELDDLQRSAIYPWQHNAAKNLHGWKKHIHHAGKPQQLTREDYEAALKAASAPVVDKETGRSNYVPHKPALSEHIGRRV